MSCLLTLLHNFYNLIIPETFFVKCLVTTQSGEIYPKIKSQSIFELILLSNLPLDKYFKSLILKVNYGVI